MKRLSIAAGAAALTIGFASQALGNVEMSVNCPADYRAVAEVNLVDFVPGRSIDGTLKLTVDGALVTEKPVSFTGPSHTESILVGGVSGNYHATFTVGGESWAAAVSGVKCSPPLPPAPSPDGPIFPHPAQPQPSQPEAGKKRPSCSWLNQVGAGRKWYVKFGCKIPANRKPKINCGDVPPNAGINWFNGKRLGFKCPLPPHRRPPAAHVPVTW